MIQIVDCGRAGFLWSKNPMSVAASCVEVNAISMVGGYRFTLRFTIPNQGSVAPTGL